MEANVTGPVGVYNQHWRLYRALGAVLTAWDITVITRNVIHRYQLITGTGTREL